jgi:hypothetical protein
VGIKRKTRATKGKRRDESKWKCLNKEDNVAKLPLTVYRCVLILTISSGETEVPNNESLDKDDFSRFALSAISTLLFRGRKNA